VRTSPPTVLISSRIDELGAARRAAFRAVHDEGWIPLLYEVEPDQWLINLLYAPSHESLAFQRTNRARINERLSIDNLLHKADRFIGVYGTSLGDPSPQLGGLRPLEYEFVRFLSKHVSAKQGVPDPLEHLFHGASASSCEEVRSVLVSALAELCNESSPHHAVFLERMAIFLKRNQGDVPASSLMYHTIHKLQRALPHTVVGFFMPRAIEVSERRTVYRRPSSHLYIRIRERIRGWRRLYEPLEASVHASDPFWIRIESTKRVGFALEVVECVFNAGYNVLDINMGQETTNTRSLYMFVAPYLNVRVNQTVVEALDECHVLAEVCESPPKSLQPLTANGPVWHLQTIVANRPGMLARVLTALALIHMRVLNIKFMPGQSTAVTDNRSHIDLWFEHDSNYPVGFADPDLPYPDDTQFLLDCIAAELTLLPGFYSVSPAQLWSSASNEDLIPRSEQS
jgi:hypothetical protein